MESEKDVICTRQIDSHKILQSLFQSHLIVEFSWNTMHYNWYYYTIYFFSIKEFFTLFFNKKFYGRTRCDHPWMAGGPDNFASAWGKPWGNSHSIAINTLFLCEISSMKSRVSFHFLIFPISYRSPCEWQMEAPRNAFREREREKESLKMSVFKRLLYHNGFPSYPNSDVLDLKQTSVCIVFRSYIYALHIYFWLDS